MDKKIKNTLKGAGFGAVAGAGIAAVWEVIKSIAKSIIR